MTNTNLLEGRIVVKKVYSEINGELAVVRDLAFGTYIRGGGLPQSGGLAEAIWKSTLNGIKSANFTPSSALIVGLGGGSIAKIIRNNWPNCKITGVDIDPVMVSLGKEYLGLDKSNVEVHIKDAGAFISDQLNNRQKYDLVSFDTYVQAEFPKKFESLSLIKQVKKLLSNSGTAIFNRLYGPNDRDSAIEFEKTLERVFGKVERHYPEANVMFVCGS